MTSGLIACAAAVVVAAALGLLWRARTGRLRRVAPPARSGPAAASPLVSAEEIGQALGPRATLLQFSSEVCAPCRAAARLLAEIAAASEGVTHVEIDAPSRLDLVRRLDVRKTPTVFVLGPQGRIARRASGVPRKADLVAALDALD